VRREQTFSPTIAILRTQVATLVFMGKAHSSTLYGSSFPIYVVARSLIKVLASANFSHGFG